MLRSRGRAMLRPLTRWQCCCCCCCWPAPLGAMPPLYRWVDAQGVVHYSDTPQPGAEKVHIAPAQTYPAPPAPAASAAPRPRRRPPASAYQSCAITQPAPEQSFYAPEIGSGRSPGRPAPASRRSAGRDAGWQRRCSRSRRSAADLISCPCPIAARTPSGGGARCRAATLLCNAAPVTFYVAASLADSRRQSPAKGH